MLVVFLLFVFFGELSNTAFSTGGRVGLIKVAHLTLKALDFGPDKVLGGCVFHPTL